MPDAARPPSTLDMLARWEPARLDNAGFYSGIDDASGTVRVMGAGIWSEVDAERYYVEQWRIVEEARRRFGQVKVFFDVRNWIVENPQSALQFQAMNSDIYRPDDRLVAVVNCCLSKQHPRTALCVGNTGAFVSMNAAETWLQAYSTTSQRP